MGKVTIEKVKNGYVAKVGNDTFAFQTLKNLLFWLNQQWADEQQASEV